MKYIITIFFCGIFTMNAQDISIGLNLAVKVYNNYDLNTQSLTQRITIANYSPNVIYILSPQYMSKYKINLRRDDMVYPVMASILGPFSSYFPSTGIIPLKELNYKDSVEIVLSFLDIDTTKNEYFIKIWMDYIVIDECNKDFDKKLIFDEQKNPSIQSVDYGEFRSTNYQLLLPFK